MVHHSDQGKWQPPALGGAHPNSTARAVRRQRPKASPHHPAVRPGTGSFDELRKVARRPRRVRLKEIGEAFQVSACSSVRRVVERLNTVVAVHARPRQRVDEDHWDHRQEPRAELTPFTNFRYAFHYGLNYLRASRFPRQKPTLSGSFTITASPFAQISPSADNVTATTTFRSEISFGLPFNSRTLPMGVGFK